MARYFFDLHDDLDSADPEGKDLPNRKAALDRAVVEAREMICASVKEGHIDLTHRIDVRDTDGDVIASVEFEDAVKVMRGGQPV